MSLTFVLANAEQIANVADAYKSAGDMTKADETYALFAWAALLAPSTVNLYTETDYGYEDEPDYYDVAHASIGTADVCIPVPMLTPAAISQARAKLVDRIEHWRLPADLPASAADEWAAIIAAIGPTFLADARRWALSRETA